MFQVIAMWNLIRPDLEMKDSVKDIKLRGYNSNPEDKVFLTGQFAAKIKSEEIRSLSVSDIADRYCPTRRDLYYKKGINRPRKNRISTWGGTAGRIVENFLFEFTNTMCKRNKMTYKNIRKINNQFSGCFRKSNQQHFNELSNPKGKDYEDPDWLLKLLNSNGRAELATKLLHPLVFENSKDVNLNHLKLNTASSLKLKPNPTELGISSSVEPDFLIEGYKVVGDIKSGTEFKPFHQFTCTGYALAYENEKGEGHNINWGIIYFFLTRNPSAYVKPITFAQIYIFPIDDNLRRWFLDFRNTDYGIIGKNKPPRFPGKEERAHCNYCQFKEQCRSEGLII